MISDKMNQDTKDINDFNINNLDFEPVEQASIDITSLIDVNPHSIGQGDLNKVLASPISSQNMHRQGVALQEVPRTGIARRVSNVSTTFSAVYYEECLVFSLDAPGLRKEDIKIIPEMNSISVSYIRNLDYSEYDSLYGERIDSKTNVNMSEVVVPIRLEKIIDSIKWSYKNGLITIIAFYRKVSTIVVEEE